MTAPAPSPVDLFLPIMALAIMCVWATHTSTLVPESAPGSTPAHQPIQEFLLVKTPSPKYFFFFFWWGGYPSPTLVAKPGVWATATVPGEPEPPWPPERPARPWPPEQPAPPWPPELPTPPWPQEWPASPWPLETPTLPTLVVPSMARGRAYWEGRVMSPSPSVSPSLDSTSQDPSGSSPALHFSSLIITSYHSSSAPFIMSSLPSLEARSRLWICTTSLSTPMSSSTIVLPVLYSLVVPTSIPGSPHPLLSVVSMLFGPWITWKRHKDCISHR
ncbi:hypothetical protein ABG768_004475 [Culter alburnus]|uniref:Uncharacterized protein n=1 Tax=Culter alburnus TaxID=194366 RepID=A0AAW1ZWM8_CULAL